MVGSLGGVRTEVVPSTGRTVSIVDVSALQDSPTTTVMVSICLSLLSIKHNMMKLRIIFNKSYTLYVFDILRFYLSAILEFTPSPTSPPTTLPPTLVPPQCSSWSPQTCRNGGSIVVVNGQCGCQCTSGWTGLYCDGKLFFSKTKSQ